jgi:Protein of unknown function (DUF1549)/Protein of unknown function (DUF1553)
MCLLLVCALVMLPSSVAADPRITQLIDEHINARLRAENITPAGRADDATLLRRIYLDLLGRPPSATEAQAFLDDAAQDKVHRLIERLRLYPETAAHWRRVIAAWLQVANSQSRGLDGNPVLDYLALAIAENKGWNVLARELLDPDRDDPHQRGASSYLGHFLRGEDKKAGREAATIAVGSAFFGVQLQCARCHNHPTVPAWTKAHFDGLRAFFDQTDVDSNVRSRTVSTDRLVDWDPAKDAIPPMFLDGTKFEPSNRSRAKLARHALTAKATHFKRAVVNRVWSQFLGRGLVEPVDMIHEGNPGSHPQLLTLLADDFAANRFNFDRLIASIMHSEAYLRSARWTGPADKRPAPELFAVASLRPLSGPQFAWSVVMATRYDREIVARSRHLNLPQAPRGLALEARYLGESTADYVKLADTFRISGSPTTARNAVYLTFDPFMKGLLSPSWGLVKELAEESDDEAATRLAYLVILNRRPTADEIEAVREHLKSAKDRKTGCQDLTWALIASAEFRFNH